MNRRVLASFVIIAAFPTAATGQQPTPTHSVQGAVRLVDARGRVVEVTTGVGLALRVVRLHVPADVRVTAAGTALPLGQLAAGDIVRVSYGVRPADGGGGGGGYLAYTIERVGRMATGLEGAP